MSPASKVAKFDPKPMVTSRRPAFSEVSIRTAAWYGDRLVRLEFPAEWDVTVLRPRTPPPITDAQILEALEHPISQPPLRTLCRGKSSPLILVDDLNRPTPASMVIPFVLRHFQEAGIPPSRVRILVASGTHQPPERDAVLKKVGESCSCQILVHDVTRNLVRIGTTSFGTPILVNKEVAASDFVVGIGGVYPNNQAGFGGGSKLALGVLGFRTIAHLHHRHKGAGWGSGTGDCNFRRDLDEIAGMIGLRTIISLSVNADREAIHVISGDPLPCHREEVAFAVQTFSVPPPRNADLVISNAYPNDASLTFVHMKGTNPLRKCAPGVSRVAIASCSEGLGHHGLFPLVPPSRISRHRQTLQRILAWGPREIPRGIKAEIVAPLRAKWLAYWRRQAPRGSAALNPIWVYQPDGPSEGLPSQVRGYQIRRSWPDILEAVRREQSGNKQLRVLIYACAPLQCFGAAQVAQKPFAAESDFAGHPNPENDVAASERSAAC
jgi:lactate racemase